MIYIPVINKPDISVASLFVSYGKKVDIAIVSLWGDVAGKVAWLDEVWRSDTSSDQGEGRVRVDQAHLITLRSWLCSIDERLKSVRNKDFDLIIDELTQAVLQFSRLCEQAHRKSVAD